MNVTTTQQSFGERELSALNARVDALSMRDADEWDEAIDWGVPDVATTCPLEWRIIDARRNSIDRPRPPLRRCGRHADMVVWSG